MQHLEEMIRTHPLATGADRGLTDCIAACHECGAACTSCADACLGEPMVAELRRCIRLNLDCAAICAVTGDVLTRQTETPTELVRRQLEVCAAACRECAEECETHAEMHEHCRVCAAACRECERACQEMLQAA